MSNEIDFVFFGTGRIARLVLEEMILAGFTPTLVVTSPDAPQGRGMQVAASPVADYAATQDIGTWKPERIDADFCAKLAAGKWPVFIVADYGYILPQTLLDIPKRGALNVHPSLLPRLRGPSPIRSAILADERDTGVSIIVLDAEMDHGAIIAQKKVAIPEWPPRAVELEETLARSGGKLLAEILPHWIEGEIDATEQNHDVATYCEKFEKEDGLIDLNADAHQNLLKVRAYEGWPGTYTYFEKGGKKIRVKILDAHVEESEFKIDIVVPEGKRVMPYDEFIRSGAKPYTK